MRLGFTGDLSCPCPTLLVGCPDGGEQALDAACGTNGHQKRSCGNLSNDQPEIEVRAEFQGDMLGPGRAYCCAWAAPGWKMCLMRSTAARRTSASFSAI